MYTTPGRPDRLTAEQAALLVERQYELAWLAGELAALSEPVPGVPPTPDAARAFGLARRSRELLLRAVERLDRALAAAAPR